MGSDGVAIESNQACSKTIIWHHHRLTTEQVRAHQTIQQQERRKKTVHIGRTKTNPDLQIKKNTNHFRAKSWIAELNFDCLRTCIDRYVLAKSCIPGPPLPPPAAAAPAPSHPYPPRESTELAAGLAALQSVKERGYARLHRH